MKYIRKCRHCRKDFYTVHRNEQICSDICRNKRKYLQDKSWREDRINTNRNILKEHIGGQWRCYHCKTIFKGMEYLDWHHINPKDKIKPVTALIERASNTLMKEVNKCILLCPNCHRAEHIRLKEENV